MINIAIVDDCEKELNKAKTICKAYGENHPNLNINVYTFSGSQCFLSSNKTIDIDFDLIILDIYMPELTGIELAHIIRDKNKNSEIIFLTTSPSHAVEAFALNAAHYVLKPYNPDQLNGAIAKALCNIKRKKDAQINLKVSSGVLKVLFSDIIYTETDKHKQNIHLKDDKLVEVRITCTSLFDKLIHDKRFFKFGSTYILNLDKIKEITVNSIFLDNGDELKMQRRHYSSLLDSYTSYALESDFS